MNVSPVVASKYFRHLVDVKYGRHPNVSVDKLRDIKGMSLKRYDTLKAYEQKQQQLENHIVVLEKRLSEVLDQLEIYRNMVHKQNPSRQKIDQLEQTYLKLKDNPDIAAEQLANIQKRIERLKASM